MSVRAGDVWKPPRPRAAPPPLALRWNAAWTFGGQTIYAVCQWGVLAVLAKLGTPELVGAYALALAISAPAFQLSGLQLRALLVTDASRAVPFANYLGLRLATASAALLGVMALAAFTLDRGAALVVVLVALAKTIEAVSDIGYGLLQREERMDRIALAHVLRGGLMLLAFGGAFWLTASLPVALSALLGAWIVVLVGYERRQLYRFGASLRPRWSGPKARRLVGLGWPLGVVMLLISLDTNAPRYVIEAVLGSGELGLFAALAYVGMAGSLTANALGQAASARLSVLYAQGERASFRRLVGRLLGVVGGLGAAGVALAWLIGPTLLALLYTPEYAVRPVLFVGLMGVTVLGMLASVLGYAMTAARRFRAQVPVFGAALGVGFGVAVVAVPAYGLWGAVAALAASACVRLVGSALVLRFSLRSSPRSHA